MSLGVNSGSWKSRSMVGPSDEEGTKAVGHQLFVERLAQEDDLREVGPAHRERIDRVAAGVDQGLQPEDQLVAAVLSERAQEDALLDPVQAGLEACPGGLVTRAVLADVIEDPGQHEAHPR